MRPMRTQQSHKDALVTTNSAELSRVVHMALPALNTERRWSQFWWSGRWGSRRGSVHYCFDCCFHCGW